MATSPSIRGSATTTTSTSGSTVTLNVPSGARPGDVLIASIAVDVIVTITPPSGWKLLKRTDDAAFGNDQVLETYTRLVDGTEAASYSWTLGSAQAFCGGMAIVQDAIQTTLPHAYDDQANAASATGTAPSLKLYARNCLLVGVFASDISPSAAITTTSGMTTEIVDVNTGTWANLAMYTEVVTNAGATGTRTCTFSAASQGSMGHLVAFAPYVPPRATSLIALHDSEDEGHFNELKSANWW